MQLKGSKFELPSQEGHHHKQEYFCWRKRTNAWVVSHEGRDPKSEASSHTLAFTVTKRTEGKATSYSSLMLSKVAVALRA